VIARICPSSRTIPCGQQRAVPEVATILSANRGWLTAHWNACSAPIEKPTTALRWWMPRPSSSSRRTASTLSRIVVTGKRGPWNGSGELLGLEERPKVLPGVERPAFSDQPVVPVALGHVVRGQQDRVVLRGIEGSVRPVDHHCPGERDATLELEALDAERAGDGSRLLRRLVGSGGPDEHAEREWQEDEREAPRRGAPGLWAHGAASFTQRAPRRAP
jgi:hypothetical protein